MSFYNCGHFVLRTENKIHMNKLFSHEINLLHWSAVNWQSQWNINVIFFVILFLYGSFMVFRLQGNRLNYMSSDKLCFQLWSSNLWVIILSVPAVH